MLKKINVWLLLILLLAFAFRFIGINHGFPFIFHPDEPALVRTALSIRFFPNPKHFDWPYLFVYLNYFLYMLFAKVRTALESTVLKSSVPFLWNDALVFYFLSRLFAACLGAVTVIPVFLTGKKLFSKRAGLFSALVFALFPFHVSHSHYALIDVPMVFFLAWSVYFSTRIFLKGKMKDYVLAGVFMGFAASTKYHGALGALVIVLGHLLRVGVSLRNINLKVWKPLVISALCSVVAFLVGTPYALLDFKTFVRTDGPTGALWQFTNVGSVPFFNQVAKFFGFFAGKFSEDMGITFMAVFVLLVFDVGYMVVQRVRRKEDMHIVGSQALRSYLSEGHGASLLLRLRESLRSRDPAVFKKLLFLVLPALILMFYISGFEKSRSHYFMIAYPFVAVAVGSFIGEFMSKDKLRISKLLLVLLIFVVPFVFSAKVVYAFARGDTRLALYDWLTSTVSKEDVLIYDGGDLALLFEKFPENTVRKSKSIGVTDLMNFEGYLIISMEEDRSISVFGDRVEIDILIEDSPVYEIKPIFLRGPWVHVYKLPVLK